ncbi:hypothetical protein [Aquimarina muelleri]|uniref:Uncharacterized protein n=1 Tax=Aquimarina muelleri TaxID=279356 RepID=A0A918JVJ3_9FLAO|nr:hypothetical protein [Aquimarina muelleri]MCX2762293.1 hypothetical protein [Aquimarina muelleri]GGX17796.1 hypothetical protein GCM10007384_19000 [Aquimarina muelleri]
MHKFVTILLATIVLTYNMSTAIIIADFLVNQKIIAKTLCVQKEAPKGCNGKCQLRKSLRKYQNKKSTKGPVHNHKRMAPEFCYIQPINNFDFILLPKRTSLKIINTIRYTTISKYYDIDIPPPIYG